jgi:WD40 repeat protein
VRTVAFSSNGQQLATGSRDGMIKLWQLQGESLVIQRTLRADQSDVFSIAYSSDGQLLASGNQHGIDLWDVKSGTLLETLTDHSGDVLSVMFCKQSLRLASGSYDQTVKIWQPQS